MLGGAAIVHAGKDAPQEALDSRYDRRGIRCGHAENFGRVALAIPRDAHPGSDAAGALEPGKYLRREITEGNNLLRTFVELIY